MRNVKKFLALVLAMLMVVSAAATVSAFEDVADDHVFAAAINDLTVKEIVNGYDGETFGPDDAVTRQQMALMMARAITGNVGDDAVWAQGGLVGFEDVTEYQYAIATVVKAGIVDGFLDNTFRPEEGITFVQALKMAVCALGYDDGNLEWWNGYYNVALDLGLTENLNYITDADKALNRGEVAQLIYNMLYVELADGSDCFASQNFGLATTENVTTFIITATDKQTAAKGMDVTEGGFVGVQQLVNGVPTGDVYYIENEAFGFEDDEDEDAFLHAYNFVNWDNGDFDQIIPTGNVDKIYNTEITEADTKFTYDGKNYYPVDELSGTKIKNEVVVYNATNYKHTATNKQLFLNKAGQVLDPETGVAVLEAVYAVNGDVVSYRELRGDNEGKYLSIAAATEKYGVEIGEITVPYQTMTGADLDYAYELTIFDDDMDGKMDRAYYTPVYVSVHDTKTDTTNGVSSTAVYGPFTGVALSKLIFTEELEKGDVYKYTYNEQTKVVTVMGIYGEDKGLLTRVNTRNDDNSGNYTVKLTIDGEVYTMGNVARENKGGLDGFVIYDKTPDVNALANLVGKKNNGNDFNSGKSSINYTYDVTDAFNSLDSGDTVRFVAVDGVIVLIEAYDIEEAFDLVVIDEIVDYDLEAVYVDMYINGELEQDVAISKIYDETTDKYVTLSDLNVFKLYNLVGKLSDGIKGNIYRAVPTVDGSYQISAEFPNAKKAVKTQSDEDDLWYYNEPDAFKLAYLDSDATILFEDGIADQRVTSTGNKTISNDNLVLRTKSTTLFYFLKQNEEGEIVSIYTYEGKPEDGAVINMDGANAVYANKLGYNNNMDGSDSDNCINAAAGTADVVIVYYTNTADIKGFGVTSVGEKVVYISEWTHNTNVDHDGFLEEREYALGSEFDLDRMYNDTYMYQYVGNHAVDMATGARVTTIYSPFKLVADEFYILSSENVAIKLAEEEYTIYEVEMAKSDVKAVREYWQIDKVTAEVGAVDIDTIVFAQAGKELSTSYVKTDSNVLTSTEGMVNVVKFIDDFEDEVFVGVWYAATEATDDNEGEGEGETETAAITATGTMVREEGEDSKTYDATLELATTAFEGGAIQINGGKNWMIDYDTSSLAIYKGDKSNKLTNVEYTAALSEDKYTLTLDVVDSNSFTGEALELEAGEAYLVVLRLRTLNDEGDDDDIVREFNFVIDVPAADAE